MTVESIPVKYRSSTTGRLRRRIVLPAAVAVSVESVMDSQESAASALKFRNDALRITQKVLARIAVSDQEARKKLLAFLSRMENLKMKKPPSPILFTPTRTPKPNVPATVNVSPRSAARVARNPSRGGRRGSRDERRLSEF